MSESIKIIYMGTPEFAVQPLRAILSDVRGADVSAVVTQPVRGKGRGRKPTPSPVEAFSAELGLRVWSPLALKESAFIEELRREAPDVIIVVAYGQILPQSILEIPRLGCVNLHASLLPLYRGAAPINRVIMDGASETGVTTMLMDKGMDTGPMLLKERLSIGEDETAEELTGRLSVMGARLLVKTIRELRAGRLKAEPQDSALATYAPSLKKSEGLIDWSKGAVEIKNLTRGVYPWPGAYTTRKGKTLKVHEVRVGEADATDCIGAEPGTIVRVEKESFFVQTGEGLLEILKVQPENKKKMEVRAFIAGYKPAAGEVLGG